jgi:Zn-dependent M28 family amino/carboxypeptidase
VTLEQESGTDTTPVPGFVEIRDQTAARALGIDPAALRATERRSARRLEGITVTLHVRERVVSATSAPNVIGILEGSDPKLRNEYVFFTAHMDHLGVASSRNPACQARGGDSICNGADDDASGTAAVIENAEAFSQLIPHPARSLVFMTVSGEEKGLWGSEYFTAHPTVPLSAVVADLNADMVGRNWKDTIAVIGKEQSDLGATLDRVARAHPELHITPIGDIWPSENFYSRSDHYNFARRGVPILFFFNGTHADYHMVSDEVSKIDAEKESRIVRLVFYVGLEIATATARPRWDPASYRRVVEGAN